jgi:hypothetical protein
MPLRDGRLIIGQACPAPAVAFSPQVTGQARPGKGECDDWIFMDILTDYRVRAKPKPYPLIDLEYIDVLLESFPEPWAVLLGFIDESGTDQVSPAMFVVGVLFKRKAQKKLNKEWKKALKKYGITHFHATDCQNRRKEFRGKSEDFCREAFKSFVEIATSHVLAAARVRTIPETEFDAIRKGRWEYSQYTTAAYMCIQLLLNHVRDLGHHNLNVFLESSPRQGQLPELLRLGRRDPRWSEFRSHAFVEKEVMAGLQVADIYAYECARGDRDHAAGKNKLRGSFEAILKTQHLKEVQLGSTALNALMNMVGPPP